MSVLNIHADVPQETLADLATTEYDGHEVLEALLQFGTDMDAESRHELVVSVKKHNAGDEP